MTTNKHDGWQPPPDRIRPEPTIIINGQERSLSDAIQLFGASVSTIADYPVRVTRSGEPEREHDRVVADLRRLGDALRERIAAEMRELYSYRATMEGAELDKARRSVRAIRLTYESMVALVAGRLEAVVGAYAHAYTMRSIELGERFDDDEPTSGAVRTNGGGS